MKSCGRCPHTKHLGLECAIIVDDEKGFLCGCSEAKRAAVLALRQLSGILFGIFGMPPSELQLRVRAAEVEAENKIMEIPGRLSNGNG